MKTSLPDVVVLSSRDQRKEVVDRSQEPMTSRALVARLRSINDSIVLVVVVWINRERGVCIFNDLNRGYEFVQW